MFSPILEISPQPLASRWPAEALRRRRRLTGRQRADRVKGQHVAFFTFYAPEAREILNDLFEEYAADGEVQFPLPDVLKVPFHFPPP